jgi:hypothetical protein
MDRRKFISTLIGGVAASAAMRTFPFRVFSFPSEIEIPNYAAEIYRAGLYYGVYNPRYGYRLVNIETPHRLYDPDGMTEFLSCGDPILTYLAKSLPLTGSTSPRLFQSPIARNYSTE